MGFRRQLPIEAYVNPSAHAVFDHTLIRRVLSIGLGVRPQELQAEELLRVAAGLGYEFFEGNVTEFGEEPGGVGYVGRFVWLFPADGNR